MGISLSFLNQLTPYSIILKRNKIILHHSSSCCRTCFSLLVNSSSVAGRNYLRENVGWSVKYYLVPHGGTNCSCREQIRYVRHKRYLTLIHNLLNRLPPGCHMPFVGILVWTDLDPRRVTYGRDFNAQVSKKLSESQIS